MSAAKGVSAAWALPWTQIGVFAHVRREVSFRCLDADTTLNALHVGLRTRSLQLASVIALFYSLFVPGAQGPSSYCEHGGLAIAHTVLLALAVEKPPMHRNPDNGHGHHTSKGGAGNLPRLHRPGGRCCSHNVDNHKAVYARPHTPDHTGLVCYIGRAIVRVRTPLPRLIVREYKQNYDTLPQRLGRVNGDRDVININSKMVQMDIVQAVNAHMTGDWSVAEASYRQAIAADPRNAAVLCNYGAFLQDSRQDMVGAEELYRNAILADASHVQAMYNLGNLLWDVHGDARGAREQFEAALSVNLDNVSTLCNLGQLTALTDENNLEGAEAYFQQALQSWMTTKKRQH